jgi:hypothetical protein
MILTENTISTPEVVLICKDKDITYNEVINLFYEFGDIMQNILYKSTVGKINSDNEFNNLIPIIFKHIALDPDTIKIISSAKKNPDIVSDHINTTINMTKSIDLRKKLVSAKFDHVLHNSEPLLMKLDSIDQEEKNKLIYDTYFTIYKDIFNYPHKKIPKNIDPNVISKIISKQNFQYSTIINEIFGYACYHMIKYENKILEFNSIFFENCDTTFGSMIKTFISNVDYMDLYLTNVFNLSNENISTYYDDNTELDINDIADNDNIQIFKSYQ